MIAPAPAVPTLQKASVKWPTIRMGDDDAPIGVMSPRDWCLRLGGTAVGSQF